MAKILGVATELPESTETVRYIGGDYQSGLTYWMEQIKHEMGQIRSFGYEPREIFMPVPIWTAMMDEFRQIADVSVQQSSDSRQIYNTPVTLRHDMTFIVIVGGKDQSDV